MKKLINIFLFSFLAIINTFASTPTDSTGLLGDDFSLQGALEIFKNSNSPEDFENNLNKEDNYINNLDLNEDGDIDYIRIIDNMDQDVHAIVLQAVISESESQDIAVIEIEKTGNEEATLQIVGDELLYGAETYIEPFEEEGTQEGKSGPSADYHISRIVVNVWLWPSVQYVYAPRYTVWSSPWHWNSYPRYWKPWRPHPWRWHFNKRSHYHHHHRAVHVHRVKRAHKIYTPRRKSSVRVKTTHTTRINKHGKVTKTHKTTVKKGNKKVTHKKITATKGNKTVKKNKTTVKTKNKKVTKKKTTVKKGNKKATRKTTKVKKRGKR